MIKIVTMVNGNTGAAVGRSRNCWQKRLGWKTVGPVVDPEEIARLANCP